MLVFLYTNKFGKIVRVLLTWRWLSSVSGFWADSKISRFFINSFIKSYKIDMSEYEIPADGYKTFNEFFYRKLKPGARLIDLNPNSVVSPADCSLLVIERLNSESSFFVKESKFNLEAFLQNKNLASEFVQGTVFLFRLAPHNYHRFHFPFDCVANQPQRIKGKFESVNPVVYKSGVQPLTENERHLIILNSEKFGKVLFVSVGAMLVGKVVETYDSTKFHKKGDEVGYFAFGGSSIVMIFQKGVVAPDGVFSQNSLQNQETVVKMGQIVAKC